LEQFDIIRFGVELEIVERGIGGVVGGGVVGIGGVVGGRHIKPEGKEFRLLPPIDFI